MAFKKIFFKDGHRICPAFFVAALIFSVFTLSGIVSAAWFDAPNTPPNYGVSGCVAPCLEEDFRPMNLSATAQTKRAGATFEGNIIADGFYDRQNPAFVIDPASPIFSLNLAGHAVINANSSVIGGQFVVNNPRDDAKTGSVGDALYAFANSTNAAVSAEQANPAGYALYASGGIGGTSAAFSDAINSSLRIQHPGPGITRLDTDAGNSLVISNAGVERMRVDGIGNIGIGTAGPTEKLDVTGKIRSSNGGFVFPDGTVQTSAAPAGGLLMRAIHTFKDCISQGGQVFFIDEGKNICRFPALPSGWTQYPQNWTTTQNVVCNDTQDAPEGWEGAPTRTPCNTGSHAFADLPTESCVATSTGTQCWYTGFLGTNKVCGSATTSTTCYATVIERGGY